MSLTSDERKSVVEFRIEKARRALEQAQGVVIHTMESFISLGSIL